MDEARSSVRLMGRSNHLNASQRLPSGLQKQNLVGRDARKQPPTDMMLCLLKDTKLNVVRLGYRTSGGGWCVTDQTMRFVPQVWARIP
jgi:hypothetical protein